MARIEIKPLSINEAYRGKVYKSPEYKQYTKDIPLLLPKFTVPDGNLELTLEFGFSSMASDVDNCIKPFLDMLQECYGFNDKRVYKVTAEKKIVKKGEEYIKFDLALYTL